MNYLKNIQSGIDFIEENLNYSLGPTEIAIKAAMSRWHFQRSFKAITGETLKTYIRGRRLSNSLDKLLKTDNKIIDIAIEAGFESQESFSRAFKKAFSLTPGEFRSLGDHHLFLRKIQIDENYLKHINQNLSMTPEIISEDARTFIGCKVRFYGADSDKNNFAEKIPALWQEFLPRLSEIKNTIAGTCYGIIQEVPERSDELEYHCVIGVESVEFVPNGMSILELPATKYAKFTHQGDVSSLDNTVNYIYSSWLLSSKYKYGNTADIEAYGSEYHPTSDESVMYYLVPIL